MNETTELKQSQVPSALQHGILSRYSILPWEDSGEYEALTVQIAGEYLPQSATERHLVEELAGIIWRKARLRSAEKAAYRQRLYSQVKDCNLSSYDSSVKIALLNPVDKWNADLQSVFTTPPDEIEKSVKSLETASEKYKQARAAIKPEDTYEQALESLPQAIREEWLQWPSKKMINSESMYWKDTESVRRWLADLIRLYDNTIDERRNAPGIKEQAIGQSFPSDDVMGTLCRYETHLDRKFERTLTVLLRLQEMKRNKENQTPSSEVA